MVHHTQETLTQQIRLVLIRGACIYCIACALFLMPSANASAFSAVLDTAESFVEASENPLTTSVAQRSDNSRQSVRSRSEVVQEVKRRYNAEVLKITLNQSRSHYRVRILLPSGKVRNIQVRATR